MNRVLVASGTHELGTGMYTIDAQLGDTILPEAPISAGSMSVASVIPAVQAAAGEAKLKLIAMAISDPRSPLHGA